MFVWSDGLVEAEKDRSKVGFRAFAGIWFELGLDVDDECRADRREQTSLRIWSTPDTVVQRISEPYKNESGVQILIVLLHVFRVVLRCLPFVYGVKVKLGILVLDWLEVHS